MKIMVFLHGTALMHKNGLGRMREQRVKQVLDGDESVYDFASYTPVDRSGKRYHDVAESVLPDLLIEDDCESIGGEREMAYPHLRPEFKAKIKSIAVKEFGGIDHLPDDISALVNC